MRPPGLWLLDPALPILLVHVVHEGHVLLNIPNLLLLPSLLSPVFLAQMPPPSLAPNIRLLEYIPQHLPLPPFLLLQTQISHLRSRQIVHLRRLRPGVGD